MKLLFVGTIPTVLIALFFKDFFEKSFGGELLFVGFLTTAILLFFASKIEKKSVKNNISGAFYFNKNKKYVNQNDKICDFNNNIKININNDKIVTNKNKTEVVENYINKKEIFEDYKNKDKVNKNYKNIEFVKNNKIIYKNKNIIIKNNIINNEKITYKKAILIGIFQGLAIFPGLSRSGSTTTCALFLSVKKSEALEFSFLLSIPIILASLLYEIIFSPISFSSLGFSQISIGFLASFIFGIISIFLTKKIVKDNYFKIFAIYLFLLSFLLFINQFFLHIFWKITSF